LSDSVPRPRAHNCAPGRSLRVAQAWMSAATADGQPKQTISHVALLIQQA
jgi:hypothetical protein